MSDRNSVLFYLPDSQKEFLWVKARQIIETLDIQHHSVIFGNIDDLMDGLSRYDTRPGFAVILAKTRQDLKEILSIQDLLLDLPIILALPDREEDTITRGHSLKPRFLTYVDGNFLDIAAVLNRMLGVVSPSIKRPLRKEQVGP